MTFSLVAGSDAFLICDLPTPKCVSIAFDSKFSILVEAAGDEGLRFRPFALESCRSNIAPQDYGRSTQLIGDVIRYLNVPTSHIAFTPYNMMLCCHRARLSMVRHCTGRLVYETTLDCVEIGGVAFDSASDTFFVSDSMTGCVLAMKYMEFHKEYKLELKFSVFPGGLCIFANFLLVANKQVSEGYCGLCYRIDDHCVNKISRIQMNKVLQSGKQQKLADAFAKQSRPSSLSGVAVLPQISSQPMKAVMLAISEDDHTMYMFKMRMRKMKENLLNVQFRCKGRDTSNFSDRDGNTRLPRSIAAITSEYAAVYYEVDAGANKLQSCGILLFRLRQH